MVVDPEMKGHILQFLFLQGSVPGGRGVEVESLDLTRSWRRLLSFLYAKRGGLSKIAAVSGFD